MESSSPEAVARAYFDAIAGRDVDALAAFWAPGGAEHIHGVAELMAPDGVRDYFRELFAAVPDYHHDVLETVADGDRVAVHWHATGTHSGAPYQGIEASGVRLDFRGLDLLTIRDGRIERNDAYADGLTVARQLGLLPEAGSAAEARLTRAFNTGSRVSRRAAAGDLEPVADGVWLLRGGIPRAMNAYVIEDESGGVTLFDAGANSMGKPLRAAAASLGGINRIVLSHAHVDHRGGVPVLGMPVWIHATERADAEGDAGRHYMHLDSLGAPVSWVYPTLQDLWDGGPVEVAGTIAEGDDVSGFTVVDIPGHSPGQVALFRERDGVALVADAFTTLNVKTGIKSGPRFPHTAFNSDDEQARASIAKLAELAPTSAWPGHGDALRGDVRAALERLAGS
jgi:hydroxyacylglutathione hydrolase